MPDDEEAAYKRLYDLTARKIDGMLYNKSMNECRFADGVAEKLTAFVKNNPPDASDLVRIIGGNTRITLAAAAQAVRSVLTNGGCVSQADGTPDLPATRLVGARLEEVIGFPVGNLSGSNTTPAARNSFLIIPTVYHKLALMCIPVNTTSHIDVCVGAFLPSVLVQFIGTHRKIHAPMLPLPPRYRIPHYTKGNFTPPEGYLPILSPGRSPYYLTPSTPSRG